MSDVLQWFRDAFAYAVDRNVAIGTVAALIAIFGAVVSALRFARGKDRGAGRITTDKSVKITSHGNGQISDVYVATGGTVIHNTGLSGADVAQIVTDLTERHNMDRNEYVDMRHQMHGMIDALGVIFRDRGMTVEQLRNAMDHLAEGDLDFARESLQDVLAEKQRESGQSLHEASDVATHLGNLSLLDDHPERALDFYTKASSLEPDSAPA